MSTVLSSLLIIGGGGGGGGGRDIAYCIILMKNTWSKQCKSHVIRQIFCDPQVNEIAWNVCSNRLKTM